MQSKSYIFNQTSTIKTRQIVGSESRRRKRRRNVSTILHRKRIMDQSLLALLDSDDLTQMDMLLNQVNLNNQDDSGADKTFLELGIAPLQASDPLSISKDLQIPLDPHHWDTSHLLRWVEWTLRQTNVDDVELWRISEQLRQRSVTGNHLAKWTSFDYDQMFNYSGETLRQQMIVWLQGMGDFYIGQAAEGPEYEYNKFSNDQLNNQLNDPSMYQTMLNSTDFSASQAEDDFVVDFHPGSVTYPQESSSPFSQDSCQGQVYPAYTWPAEEDTHSRSSSMSSSWSSDSSDDDEFFIEEQRRPLKPKSAVTKRRHPILYKFILEHLNNPSTSRGCVEWVDKSKGLFKFNSRRKDKFAEMWSKAKGKKQPMTYQNMARALRNYTRPNRRIMERVPKKLHYKFMPEFIE